VSEHFDPFSKFKLPMLVLLEDCGHEDGAEDVADLNRRNSS
jgi:hypothetical protein